MGGKAFLEKIQGATFPRMDHATYTSLKAQHFEQLSRKFRLVGVPREAPEKTSHGDIDYIVCSPVEKSINSGNIKNALGASYSVHGQTLNFAIPLHHDGNDALTFYQVDIHQCSDEDEWERTMFFHSYGDLGMMMGWVARANGLSLGLHGLKVPHTPQYNMPPFILSMDIPRILEFFGLDLAAWEAGFPKLESTFIWIASSRFFKTSVFHEAQRREHRMEDREMYQKFLGWVREHRENVGQENGHRSAPQPEKTVEEAMAFFQKKEEYESLVEEKRKKQGIKDKFNGRLVMEWTGMHGKSVQAVMNEVRKNFDEEMIHHLTSKEIKKIVLEAHERMKSTEM